MLFVFIFENACPVVDSATGMKTQPSVAIESDTYEQAISMLAAHCRVNFGYSGDLARLSDKIKQGNITVVLPTATKRVDEID